MSISTPAVAYVLDWYAIHHLLGTDGETDAFVSLFCHTGHNVGIYLN